jgi:pyruvate dehydrogenase E2 component (dihydrolipoamide acetyltransferase)
VATLKDVLVPDIGDFADVPVVELLVAVGDVVALDAPLVAVESDKATMEIPAPFAGRIESLGVAVGDTVSEGTKVAVVAVDEDAAAAPAPEQATPPTTEAAAASSVATAVVAEAQAEPEDHPAPPAPPSAHEHPGGGGSWALEVHASPVVRRLARERGIDLATVTGTGRGGRVTKEDLEGAGVADGTAATAPGTPPAAGPPVVASAGGGERVALTRIQQLAAKNLSAAWQTIPHVTQHDDADITELEAFRKQINAEQSDVKVTMVALLLKASAAALDAFPRFASSLDGNELIVKSERHIAFAADTSKGLMVPVVRDVDQKGLLQLAGELTELSDKARGGRLGPKELSGAVFTISSLGGIGGTGFTPIVNPPQVAILGAVRSATQPMWDGAAFQPRLVLPLSLSYDHRVIDGAAAARFTAHLAKLLVDLRRVLL